MIVVSDTSPLHYLILIDQVQLLPTLYGAVYAPPVVIEELLRPQTPLQVRNWTSSLPDWLVVQTPSFIPATEEIDRGEAEAIALAKELAADTILMDDRDGVQFALREGLDVTGTLGVLILAKHRGLISLRESLHALEQTNFRRSATLFAKVLHKHEPA